MAREQANLTILECGAGMAETLFGQNPDEVNHVLCCVRDESLTAFAERIFHRLSTLRRRASLNRVSYVASPSVGESLQSRSSILRRIISLLGQGATLEIIAGPSGWDPLEALEALTPLPKVGVSVRIVNTGGPRELAKARPDGRSVEQPAVKLRSERSGLHERTLALGPAAGPVEAVSA